MPANLMGTTIFRIVGPQDDRRSLCAMARAAPRLRGHAFSVSALSGDHHTVDNLAKVVTLEEGTEAVTMTVVMIHSLGCQMIGAVLSERFPRLAIHCLFCDEEMGEMPEYCLIVSGEVTHEAILDGVTLTIPHPGKQDRDSLIRLFPRNRATEIAEGIFALSPGLKPLLRRTARKNGWHAIVTGWERSALFRFLPRNARGTVIIIDGDRITLFDDVSRRGSYDHDEGLTVEALGVRFPEITREITGFLAKIAKAQAERAVESAKWRICWSENEDSEVPF